MTEAQEEWKREKELLVAEVVKLGFPGELGEVFEAILLCTIPAGRKRDGA